MRPPLLVALCVGAVLAASTLAWAVDFDTAKGKYEEKLGRRSLFKRTVGRLELAATDDERAMDILASSYTKVEEPKDRNRHLLVTVCQHYLSNPRHLPRFAKWRKAQKARRDAWLWLESLRLRLWKEGPDTAVELATKTRDPWLRAACIESLAVARHPIPNYHTQAETSSPTTLRQAVKLLDEAPSDRLGRMLHLEACSAAITSHARDEEDEDEIRAAVSRLADVLEDRKLEERTALTIVRHLSSFFEVEDSRRDPAVWRRYLEAEDAHEEGGADAAEGQTVAFVGLRATGTRIAFVIDTSDSMCTPVSEEVRAKRKRTVTASGGRPDIERTPIDWETIKTRFDVAREFLKATLRRLPDGHHFTVILFGDRARFLGGEMRLQKVSKRTIEKAIEALDDICTRSAAPNAPHGVLRGETNMHGGLRRAFLMHARSNARGFGTNEDGAAYVDPKLLQTGCDTIFLLSDGIPNRDDWHALDLSDPGDTAKLRGDSGIRTQPKKEMWYAGPYGSWPHLALLDDIRRMNLFRRVEIHCVAVGEADTKLLTAISHLGNGRMVEL